MSGAPGWLKVSVGAASRVAPGPVARLAFSLYRNPNIARRFDRGVRALLGEAQAILDRAETFDERTHVGRIRFYRFRARRGAPVVLLLHAWTADARAMAAFVNPLLEVGFTVVIPDMPAHGASDGKVTDAPAAARAVMTALGAHRITPTHFIGHSFGGGVAGLLADLGMVPQRFVCLASPSRLSAVTNDFCAAFGLTRACRVRFEELVEQSLGMSVDHLDGLRIWPEKPTRILLLHAPEDAEIDFSEAERLATMPNAVLLPFPGFGHREIVYRDESVAEAVAFLTLPEEAMI
ncbi:MAG: alpha/beta hydrolase family protein [Pseudomonadota bacterium]